jgi:hypothetical protein
MLGWRTVPSSSISTTGFGFGTMGALEGPSGSIMFLLCSMSGVLSIMAATITIIFKY